MLERCEHTKANACKAALAEQLHANNRCPGNYIIHYAHGWFQLTYGWNDPMKPFQDTKLTARAEELLKRHKETGEDTIAFCKTFNTYVITGK